MARGLSGFGSWALELGLSSCGAQALLLRGMWDLPGSGIEPLSPALAGGFFTTEPPGEPCVQVFLWTYVFVSYILRIRIRIILELLCPED